METPIRLPLRVRVESEAVVVKDAIGTRLSYICFEDEPIRRSSTKRVTKAEAVEVAKVIARALTAEFGALKGASDGVPGMHQ